MVVLDLSALGSDDDALAVAMTCASAWLEAALTSATGGQRWVIYDEAWRLLRSLPLIRRMQAQWKLSRAYGIANLMVLHRLSDLDAVGAAGQRGARAGRGPARGLLHPHRLPAGERPARRHRDIPRPDRHRTRPAPRPAPRHRAVEGLRAVPRRPAPPARRRARRGRHRRRHARSDRVGGGTVNAVHLAEQATLGALMLEPRARRRRHDVVARGGLRRPVAPLGLRQHPRAPRGPRTRGPAASRPRVGRPARTRGRTCRDLLDLLQAAPTRPVGHRYAAMVLEASLRREIACHGVLLQAAALSARVVAAQPARHVQSSRRSMPASTRRAPVALTRRVTSSRPARCRAVGLGIPVSALGADRFLQAHPALDPAAVRRGEEALIASLIAHPDHIGEVARWLRPDALTHATWRPVYAAVIQLAELGEPVDVVTVAWEVHRASSRLGPGPGTRELRDAVESAGLRRPRPPGPRGRRRPGPHHRRPRRARAACGRRQPGRGPHRRPGHRAPAHRRPTRAPALPAAPRDEVPYLGLAGYDFGPERVPHASQGQATTGAGVAMTPRHRPGAPARHHDRAGGGPHVAGPGRTRRLPGACGRAVGWAPRWPASSPATGSRRPKLLPAVSALAHPGDPAGRGRPDECPRPRRVLGRDAGRRRVRRHCLLVRGGAVAARHREDGVRCTTGCGHSRGWPRSSEVQAAAGRRPCAPAPRTSARPWTGS